MSEIVKELVELESPRFTEPDMSRYRHLENACNRLLLETAPHNDRNAARKCRI